MTKKVQTRKGREKQEKNKIPTTKQANENKPNLGQPSKKLKIHLK